MWNMKQKRGGGGILTAVVAGAVLAVCSAARAQVQYQFTTLDYFASPASPGQSTTLTGISGNTIVGFASGGIGITYNGTSFMPVSVPGADVTLIHGVHNGIAVGGYDQGGVSYGFSFIGSSFSTIQDPLATNGTEAFGIFGNTIVGQYLDSQGIHGFSYNGSSFTTVNDPVDPNGTIATGISGTNVAGFYIDNGDHGFIYNGSNFTPLDDPLAAFPTSGPGGTAVYGISGTNVVGFYYDAAGLPNGFIFNGSTYTTLDDPLGVNGTTVFGIDGATVVGAYTDANDIRHGFIATPVPEPTAIALLLCGAMTLLRRQRGRRS